MVATCREDATLLQEYVNNKFALSLMITWAGRPMRHSMITLRTYTNAFSDAPPTLDGEAVPVLS